MKHFWPDSVRPLHAANLIAEDPECGRVGPPNPQVQEHGESISGARWSLALATSLDVKTRPWQGQVGPAQSGHTNQRRVAGYARLYGAWSRQFPCSLRGGLVPSWTKLSGSGKARNAVARKSRFMDHSSFPTTPMECRVNLRPASTQFAGGGVERHANRAGARALPVAVNDRALQSPRDQTESGLVNPANLGCPPVQKMDARHCTRTAQPDESWPARITLPARKVLLPPVAVWRYRGSYQPRWHNPTLTNNYE